MDQTATAAIIAINMARASHILAVVTERARSSCSGVERRSSADCLKSDATGERSIAEIVCAKRSTPPGACRCRGHRLARPDREPGARHAAGRWPLAAGRWPLAAGRWPLAAGRWPLAAGRWPLAAGRWPLAAGRWPLAAGRWPLAAGRWPLAAGRWPLAAGRWPLAAGRWPLAAGRWPLAAGRWPLAAGRWPLAAGRCLLYAPKAGAGVKCRFAGRRGRPTPEGRNPSAFIPDSPPTAADDLIPDTSTLHASPSGKSWASPDVRRFNGYRRRPHALQPGPVSRSATMNLTTAAGIQPPLHQLSMWIDECRHLGCIKFCTDSEIGAPTPRRPRVRSPTLARLLRNGRRHPDAVQAGY